MSDQLLHLSASRALRHTISAVIDGHGPVEHYSLCRRIFGQSRRRALCSTWLAYAVNTRRNP